MIRYSHFRRPFSEAYDILPKNEKDVDAIKHLSDNEKSKLKELLAFVKQETGATDPLALSPSTKEKGIKVHVWLNTYLLWSSKKLPFQKDHILLTNPEWLDHNKFSLPSRLNFYLIKEAVERSFLVSLQVLQLAHPTKNL